jgi:hypothetical protein
MDAMQYEELCRLFIADKERLALDKVRSVHLRNPKRWRLPSYRHQIDLYWETGNDIATYLNIANAKWRASAKIAQEEVELLQHVRHKVAAHKAFLITNTEFTAGAVAAARDEGIALHIVRPDFDVSDLPTGGRAAIRGRLIAMKAAAERSLWTHRIEHKGLGFDGDPVRPDITPGLALKPEPAPPAVRLLHKPALPSSAPPTPRSVDVTEKRPVPRWGSDGDGRSGFVKK